MLRRAIKPETAAQVARMMRETVANGSAFKSFHDAQGKPYIPGVAVAGKTGTLTDYKRNRFYTWFVGFAPADAPEVAISTLGREHAELANQSAADGARGAAHLLREEGHEPQPGARASRNGSRPSNPELYDSPTRVAGKSADGMHVQAESSRQWQKMPRERRCARRFGTTARTTRMSRDRGSRAR